MKKKNIFSVTILLLNSLRILVDYLLEKHKNDFGKYQYCSFMPAVA